ncbi:MAG: hypothetical protein ACL93V_07790 [Candidatus Electrothrix sp. YB6]
MRLMLIKRSVLLLFLLPLLLQSACSAVEQKELKEQNTVQIRQTEEQRLWKFAYANCLFQYFQTKGYDLHDIRAISGGYTEMTEASTETLQEIARQIELYQPELRTKQDIDPVLYKCFFLEDNEALKRIISAR